MRSRQDLWLGWCDRRLSLGNGRRSLALCLFWFPIHWFPSEWEVETLYEGHDPNRNVSNPLVSQRVGRLSTHAFWKVLQLVSNPLVSQRVGSRILSGGGFDIISFPIHWFPSEWEDDDDTPSFEGMIVSNPLVSQRVGRIRGLRSRLEQEKFPIHWFPSEWEEKSYLGAEEVSKFPIHWFPSEWEELI